MYSCWNWWTIFWIEKTPSDMSFQSYRTWMLRCMKGIFKCNVWGLACMDQITTNLTLRLRFENVDLLLILKVSSVSFQSNGTFNGHLWHNTSTTILFAFDKNAFNTFFFKQLQCAHYMSSWQSCLTIKW